MKKILSLIILFTLLGCASYRPGMLPYHRASKHKNAETKQDVTAAVKFFSCEEAAKMFDCNMCRKKIEPVFIAIENNSSKKYSFKKSQINRNFLTAGKTAKKCYYRHGWRVILLGLFEPMMGNVRRTNRKIKADYALKEIKDGVIQPFEKISGVIFISKMYNMEIISIPLVGQEGEESLLFEFNQ